MRSLIPHTSNIFRDLETGGYWEADTSSADSSGWLILAEGKKISANAHEKTCCEDTA